MSRFQTNRVLLTLSAGLTIALAGTLFLGAKPRATSAASSGTMSGATPQSAPPADAPPPGDAEKGRHLFLDKGCADCHGSDGKGTAGADHEGPQIAPPPFAFTPFVRQVRHPAGKMDAYTTDDVFDTELADIYAFFSNRQGAPSGCSRRTRRATARRCTSVMVAICATDAKVKGSTQPAGPRDWPDWRSAIGAFVSYAVRQPKLLDAAVLRQGPFKPGPDRHLRLPAIFPRAACEEHSPANPPPNQ